MSLQVDRRVVNHRIESIQCLRAIAALLVVVDHSLLTYISGNGASLTLSVHDTTRVAEALGRFGVEVFFLISGFIMTSTMYDKFAKPGASLDFLWKRIIRIVPLYWLVTLVTLGVRIHDGETPTGTQILQSFLFVPYADEDGVFQPILRRGWTLNYEMFFYAVLALALFLPRWKGLVATMVVLFAVVATAPHVPAASCHATLCALPWFYGQTIVLYFVGGIVLALVRRFLAERWLLPRVPLEGAVAAAVAIVVVYVCMMQTDLSRASMAAWGVAFAVLATCTCTLIDETGKPNPVRRVMLLLGDASYSIYLVHGFVVEPIGRVWLHVIGRHAPALFILTLVTAASLASIVTYRLIEKPSLEWLRRLGRPKPLAA